ncbi:MAG TPA: DUF4430 domain-containing protein [Thermoplasmata archaeon]|nr:DUF4430 domain-containing protein [Thermoplasmata archaeon]
MKAGIFSALIVVSAVGLILAAQTFRPQAPALTTGIPLRMTIEGSGWTIAYSSNDTRNNTVHLFLIEAARTLHFGLVWANWSAPYSAVFIEGINGSINGEGGRWWVFWVDGVYASTAADLTVLHGGETVLWRFTTPEGG